MEHSGKISFAHRYPGRQFGDIQTLLTLMSVSSTRQFVTMARLRLPKPDSSTALDLLVGYPAKYGN